MSNKFIKKPVEAVLFKDGMEDTYKYYDCYDQVLYIDVVDVKTVNDGIQLYPVIDTGDEYVEVEDGKHYIITDEKGRVSVLEKETFEESYQIYDSRIGKVVDFSVEILLDLIARGFTGDKLISEFINAKRDVSDTLRRNEDFELDSLW